MTPLSLFLVLIIIVIVMAVFKWKGYFKALKEEQEQEARDKAARRAQLGPEYKSGSSKPETALMLYEPPDDYVGEHIDPELTMDEVDVALAKRNELMSATVPPGGSRFGGLPDLPPDVPWPVFEGKKLPFLAQLDLSELPKSLLPPEGWLYVFALFDSEHNPLPLKVFHHKCLRTELIRAAKPMEIWPEDDGQSIYDTVPLKATLADGWKSEAGFLFGDLAEDEGGAGGIADEQERSGDDWITLLGISSTGSMMWSDCGWFHIVIRRQDLEKHNFSNACAGLSRVG